MIYREPWFGVVIVAFGLAFYHDALGESDCNFNGRSDLIDIATGESFDCDGDGAPDECRSAVFPNPEIGGRGGRGRPSWLSVGDVDRDGDLDFAVADDEFRDTVAVLLNDGSARFRESRVVEAIDVLVSLLDVRRVELLRGRKDGEFYDPELFRAGAGPLALAAADFNGDGAPDSLVADPRDATPRILLNQRSRLLTWIFASGM